MTSIFSEPSFAGTQAILPVSLFLVKATLLLLLALVATAALSRASAGARHIVWVSVLAAVVLLPALSYWTPLRLAIIPGSIGGMAVDPVVLQGAPSASPRAAGESSVPATWGTIPRDQSAGPSAIPAGVSHPATLDETGAARPGGEGAVASSAAHVSPTGVTRSGPTRSGGSADVLLTLTFLWAIGTLFLLTRLIAGMATVRRVVRRARPLESAEWTVPLWEVADRLDLAHAPRLLNSDDVAMPFACGLLHPAVVLPAGAERWSDERRRAVLFHELAHVRRRDLFGHTLGRIACALYWFHPLVWAAARRLRSESERACDDLVLTSGTRASDYAHHLLELVTGARNASAPATALAMARRKEFEGRMLAILDPEQRRGAPGRLQAAALIACLAALTLSVSAMAPATNRGAVGAPDAADTMAPDHGSLLARGADAGDPPLVRDADARAARPDLLADTIAAPGGRQLASSVPDTGEEIHARTLRRIIDSAVENGVRSSVEGASTMVAGIDYDGLVSDWKDYFPRIDVQSTDAIGRSVRGSVRGSVRVSLGESGAPAMARVGADSGTTDLLVKLLESDGDDRVRRTAAWALAQRGERDPRVVTGALAAALARDGSADVREMAAWGLGQIDADSAAQALRDAVRRDADERVKMTAAWALGTIGDASAIAALGAAMSDPGARVRSRAAWALGQIEPEKAPAGLVRALGDSSDEVRLAAAWALGEIGDPATLQALSDALSSERDHDIREAELRALILLGEASDATLQKLLASPDPDVRQRVTRAIVGFRGVRPWPWPMPMPRPMP